MYSKKLAYRSLSIINEPMTKTKYDQHRFQWQQTLKDLVTLSSIPVKKSYQNLVLPDYPFDHQLLSLSSVYRKSRQTYLSIAGRFQPRVCSTMRGLRSQDLFKNEIDYTPALSELLWFKDFGYKVSNASDMIQSVLRFTEISVFHEQNHRILWQLLPPAPKSKDSFCRYLNFAESLVVTLDITLADQLGKKNSQAFERLKLIYRPSGQDRYFEKSKDTYKNYLLAVFVTTYCALEFIHKEDILKAVNYILPGQKALNKVAHRRAMELSETFIHVTNPQWQSMYWTKAKTKLRRIQKRHNEPLLELPKDVLDIETELNLALRIFDFYEL